MTNYLGCAADGCEHRTVGPHRAWCFECTEWCYPAAPCVRGELAQLQQQIDAVCQLHDRTWPDHSQELEDFLADLREILNRQED